MSQHQIDIDKIVEILQHQHGLHAFKAFAGGGVGVIYAGRVVTPATAGRDAQYAAVAGPASYHSGIGWAEDFWISPDIDDDAMEPNGAAYSGAYTNEAVAALIALQATQGSTIAPLDADTLDAAGFDGTGRGAAYRTTTTTGQEA